MWRDITETSAVRESHEVDLLTNVNPPDQKVYDALKKSDRKDYVRQSVLNVINVDSMSYISYTRKKYA